MIYTIVPIEYVLDTDKEHSSAFENNNRVAFYMGENVIVRSMEGGGYSIEKLISTNPQSFLRKEFSPGAKADINKIRL